MTPEDAIQQLEASCLKDRDGLFFFSCKEGLVALKLQGIAEAVHFPARDRLGFRIGPQGLGVERLSLGTQERFYRWDEIESLVAGEPEMSGGALFQG